MKKSYFRKNKRGVVDVQFNWIFILIAGFVIFLFIISIVFKQKDNSDKQASISSVNQITSLLKGKQQTGDVYSEITIPRSEIEFRCDSDTKYFTYRVGDFERLQLPVELMFSRTTINTNKLVVWTQSFSLGFPVGVFSYVTTPDSMILIYGDSGSSEATNLYQSIPGNITRVLNRDIDKYSSSSNLVIVCFKDDCPPMSYSYIQIIPENTGIYGYGNIVFHKKNGVNEKKYPYITDASIYGAIFSNNAEFYSCQMKRAIDRYNIKRQLVDTRLSIMQKEYQGTECAIKMKIILDNDLQALSEYDLTYDTIVSISSRSESLNRRNNDLGFSSCPKVY
jgi:hypothetical protein